MPNGDLIIGEILPGSIVGCGKIEQTISYNVPFTKMTRLCNTLVNTLLGTSQSQIQKCMFLNPVIWSTLAPSGGNLQSHNNNEDNAAANSNLNNNTNNNLITTTTNNNHTNNTNNHPNTTNNHPNNTTNNHPNNTTNIHQLPANQPDDTEPPTLNPNPNLNLITNPTKCPTQNSNTHICHTPKYNTPNKEHLS